MVKKSAWIEHVKQTMKLPEHKDKKLKDVLKIAARSYKK